MQHAFFCDCFEALFLETFYEYTNGVIRVLLEMYQLFLLQVLEQHEVHLSYLLDQWALYHLSNS